MTRRRIKDANVTVGCPSCEEGWKSFMFHFHDFANLSTTRNHYVASPKITCNEHQWELRVFPSGHSTAREGNVWVYLQHLSEETITARYNVKIVDKFGKSKKAALSIKQVFTANYRWGFPDFISRSDILDESDDNGTLTIVVSIEEEPKSVFVPQNPFSDILIEMFNDQTTADVCFEVRSSEEKEDHDGKNKRAKTTTSFYAHRLILEKRSTMLAAICGSNNSGGVVTAPVNDVKPEIFRHLLSYVYGGSIPEEELNTQAKDIIDAADKYYVVNLKLAAEAAYVESTDISLDNAMDNLLYADSRNLALLKEAVMNFFADNHGEAAARIDFTDFPGHIVKDLLIAFSGKYGKTDTNGTNEGDDRLATLCVSALRRKLHKMGLDVDGSREAMIESIKSHSEEEAILE